MEVGKFKLKKSGTILVPQFEMQEEAITNFEKLKPEMQRKLVLAVFNFGLARLDMQVQFSFEPPRT